MGYTDRSVATFVRSIGGSISAASDTAEIPGTAADAALAGLEIRIDQLPNFRRHCGILRTLRGMTVDTAGMRRDFADGTSIANAAGRFKPRTPDRYNPSLG